MVPAGPTLRANRLHRDRFLLQALAGARGRLCLRSQTVMPAFSRGNVCAAGRASFVGTETDWASWWIEPAPDQAARLCETWSCESEIHTFSSHCFARAAIAAPGRRYRCRSFPASHVPVAAAPVAAAAVAASAAAAPLPSAPALPTGSRNAGARTAVFAARVACPATTTPAPARPEPPPRQPTISSKTTVPTQPRCDSGAMRRALPAQLLWFSWRLAPRAGVRLVNPSIQVRSSRCPRGRGGAPRCLCACGWGNGAGRKATATTEPLHGVGAGSRP